MNARIDGGSTPPLRHILVASDLTLAAANAAWRAAQLARKHGATLRLLQVVDDVHRVEEAQAALARLCEAMQHRLRVSAEADVVRGDFGREAARAAPGADLLVVPARDGTTWRERISGTRTERLVRTSRIPVLVVKRPVARARASAHPMPPGDNGYERVLACVDLAEGSPAVIAAAAGVGGQARLEVFHALTPAGDAPGVGAGTGMERARATLQQRILAAGAPQGTFPGVGFGSPGACVLARERAIAADLLVIGRRQGRLLGDLVLGAVVQEVLAESRCDVLLVPARALPSAAPQDNAVPERATLG